MLGFFKKKKPAHPIIAVLGSPDHMFVEFSQEVFENMDRATRAHVLVAYMNVRPLILALIQTSNQKGKEYSIDDFIITCAENAELENDDIASRRWTWFLYGGLLYRLTKVVTRTTDLKETVGDIWGLIAQDSPLLKTLLPDNIVWTNEEKVWFDTVINDHDEYFIIWTVHQAMPKSLWGTRAVKEIATKYNFHYSENAYFGPLMKSQFS